MSNSRPKFECHLSSCKRVKALSHRPFSYGAITALLNFFNRRMIAEKIRKIVQLYIRFYRVLNALTALRAHSVLTHGYINGDYLASLISFFSS